jgi:hypothetical protein
VLSRRDVLRYLPRLGQLKKKVTLKERQARKLWEEAGRLQTIINDLRGVELYNGFPLKTLRYMGGVDILSGYKESNRSAYVRLVGAGPKYTVLFSNNGDADLDGTPVRGEYSRRKALQIAKDFVTGGRK